MNSYTMEEIFTEMIEDGLCICCNNPYEKWKVIETMETCLGFHGDQTDPNVYADGKCFPWVGMGLDDRDNIFWEVVEAGGADSIPFDEFMRIAESEAASENDFSDIENLFD